MPLRDPRHLHSPSAFYGQCLRHILEEAPAAFLYEQVETCGVRKDVRNFPRRRETRGNS